MERKRPLLVALAGVFIVAALVGGVVVLRTPSCVVVQTLRLDSVIAGCGSPQARAALAAGRAAMAQRSVREALVQFRSAAALAPSLTPAHLARGEAAEALGEFDEALAAYATAARLAPSTETNFKRGLMAEQMGDVELAVRSFEAAYGSPREHTVEGIKAAARELVACIPKRWPRLSAMFGECPVLAYVTGRTSSQFSRERVPQVVFQILVEFGQRDRALALARARQWVRPDVNYCRPDGLPIASDTAALLGMLVDPERADCLVDLGPRLADDGAARLGRLMLLDRVTNSPDPAARERAERFLRYRVPRHDVTKIAESLNAKGWRLQHRLENPDEARGVFEQAIAADPAFSWPYHNIARLYMEQKDYVQALGWLEKALAVNPDHWRAQLNLGVASYELGRYEGAREAFSRAIAMNPDDARGHAELGRTLIKLGREPEGLRLLQTAVRTDPTLQWARNLLDAKVGRDARRGATAATVVETNRWQSTGQGDPLGRAKAAFNAGRYTEALDEARQATDASPNSADALVARAGMASFMGEFDEAQTYYAKAAQLTPDDAGTLYGQAVFALRIGDYDAALQLLDRVLERHPWHVRWLFAHAPARLQPWVLRGNPNLAWVVQVKVDILMEKDDLAAARKLARDYALVRAGHDYCKAAGQRRRDRDAMFQTFRLAALGQPDAADCIWLYGQWLTDEGYVRLGRLIVLESMRTAPSEDKKAWGLRYLRVRLSGGREVPKRAEQLFLIANQRYQRDGDADAAARLFDEAIRIAPDFVRPYHYRARIVWERGDREGAIGWLVRARDADPDSWRTRRNLGRLFAELMRYDEAERELRRALELFPEDPGSRLLLGRVLYAERKFNDYVRETKTALRVAKAWRHELPEVTAFLGQFERTGAGSSLPPAPEPYLTLGWNYD